MRSLSLLLLLPTIAFAGARGSAFQKETKQGANLYAPAAAIDGKLETAWLVPGESPNRGEWMEIDVPRGEVDKLAIYNGFNKNDETFKDHPRVKKVRVDIFALDDEQNPKQVGTATVDVEDKRDWQVIDLPDTKIDAGLFGGRVRLSVVDIYDGEDFPNLGISEVRVHMKEFDAKAKVTAIDEGDPAPAAAALDEDPKTFAKFSAGQVISVESSNFGLSSIGFAPVKDYSRPKTVEITVGGQKATTVLPEKSTDIGWATVPAFNGYTGGAFGTIDIKIVDTYPGKNPEVGVSELKAKATNFEG